MKLIKHSSIGLTKLRANRYFTCSKRVAFAMADAGAFSGLFLKEMEAEWDDYLYPQCSSTSNRSSGD